MENEHRYPLVLWEWGVGERGYLVAVTTWHLLQGCHVHPVTVTRPRNYYETATTHSISRKSPYGSYGRCDHSIHRVRFDNNHPLNSISLINPPPLFVIPP